MNIYISLFYFKLFGIPLFALSLWAFALGNHDDESSFLSNNGGSASANALRWFAYPLFIIWFVIIFILGLAY
jgi:hypothetical protein